LSIDQNNITFGATIIALGTFVVKELYQGYKRAHRELAQVDSDHTRSIQANTLAIQELTGRMEYFEEYMGEVRKMRKDLLDLHGLVKSQVHRSNGKDHAAS